MQEKTTHLTLSDLKSLFDNNKPHWITCNILDNFNEYEFTTNKIILRCNAPEKTSTTKINLTISDITSIYIDSKIEYNSYIDVHIVILTKGHNYRLMAFLKKNA